jgi:hypothetical protein
VDARQLTGNIKRNRGNRMTHYRFELRTDELQPGMQVILPAKGVVRTIDRIIDSGWLNDHNQPIFYVYWAEGRTVAWSEGNSGIASTLWTVANSSLASHLRQENA